MTTPAENAATVRKGMGDWALGGRTGRALAALLAQAEAADPFAVNDYRIAQAEAERDFLLSDPDNTSIKEWHDRLKAERDAAVRERDKLRSDVQFQYERRKGAERAAEHVREALPVALSWIDHAIGYATTAEDKQWGDRLSEVLKCARAALTGEGTDG